MRILHVMRKALVCLLVCLLLGSASILEAQEIRGLYINGSNDILGDQDQEFQLLEYLIQGNFNSVTFYSFQNLDFRQAETRETLRNFIRLARSKYGVSRFGAASESLTGFTDNIHLYNTDSLTLPEDRLDHYNLEFEFWSERGTTGYYCTKYLEPNGYPCNPDGAFSFVVQLLKDLRSHISDYPEIEIDVYVGWLKEDHAAVLTQMADRILYAVYRDMNPDGSIELYDSDSQIKRLESLGQSGEISIIPIFSSYDGSTDRNLHEWLQLGHSPCEAWQQYNESFTEDILLVNKNNLHLDGYQWFRYSSMPNLPMKLRTPGPIMGPKTVQAGEAVRYIIPPTKDALLYEWQIYPSGAQYYHAAHESSKLVRFPNAGNATIMVRAIGCGMVSPFARLQVQVEGAFPIDQPVNAQSELEIQISIQNQNLHILIPPHMDGPFQIQAINLLGRKFLTRTIQTPGEYNVPIQPIPDSSKMIQVRILHAKGSYCKKLSIFDL